MILSAMRTMLRTRIDDTRSKRFTDAECVDEMNAAAEFVGNELELHGIYPRALTTTATLSVVSGTLTYTIGSDFVSLRSAFRTDVTPYQECQKIGFNERKPWTEVDRAYDDLGRPVFYLDANSSGVTLFAFPADPRQTMTITVTYQKLCPALTTSTDDANSYVLPSYTHRMIVVRAAMMLMGADNAKYDQLASEYENLHAQALSIGGRTKRRRVIGNTSGLV